MELKEEWATYYVNERFSFSYRTISLVELANRNLKSFIISGKFPLLPNWPPL